MRIQAKVDIRKVTRALSAVERQQMPFAAAVALTKTALDARDQLRGDLDKHFTIRNTWTARGIQSRRATKRDLSAVVLTRDEYMARQETGGIKRPQSGFVALPRRIRKSLQQRITKAKRPRALLQKKNVYKADAAGGNQVILRRRGRGGRGEPDLLYLLHRGPVRIRPRWNFEDTVAKTVRTKLHRHFGRELARALRTAR